MTAEFSRQAEELIRLGAERLREQGREEVREQIAAQRRVEFELDDASLRFTSNDHVARSSASVEFVMFEAVRLAHWNKSIMTIRDEKMGVFGLLLSEVTASEMAALKEFAARMMATIEERKKHERDERTGHH